MLVSRANHVRLKPLYICDAGVYISPTATTFDLFALNLVLF